MRKKFDRVYQFKIALKAIKPTVWRRIQVPETYTFWDLHVAIQDAMGWLDYHLHEFSIVNPRTGLQELIGIPDDEFIEPGRKIHPGWRRKIADYFSVENRLAHYAYDFGDDWQHSVRLEKILGRDPSVRYPVCIAGERACPPEDCGGEWGYQNFLEIIMDPTHEEYQETLEWAGGDFDPEYFRAEEVRFDDPQKRWKQAFEMEEEEEV